eukprot:2029531-Amphidinium_carterae.1
MASQVPSFSTAPEGLPRTSSCLYFRPSRAPLRPVPSHCHLRAIGVPRPPIVLLFKSLEYGGTQ